MIEQWVIDRLNPLQGAKLILLADPQRMIRAGAQAVDGWAKDNGFTVLFCSGNLALREMYESLRDPPHPQPLSPKGRGETELKIILVDRTRDKARLPLFYPDLEARCKGRCRLAIIGGVLPKLQAAIDAGCQEVIMPKENERDVQMTPDYVRNKIKVRFVSSIEEVLEAALLKTF